MNKDYWRLKKRQQRAKERVEGTKFEKVAKPKIGLPKVEVDPGELALCPDGVEPREWRYACERAAVAKRYAEKMPEFVKPSDLKYQDAEWQYENEVKGKFMNRVGGVEGSQQR